MSRLKDDYIHNIPVGSLLFPSRVVRLSGKNGNYYLEDIMAFVDDRDIFPAIILGGCHETFANVLTPTGVHTMSKFSLVSSQTTP